MNDDIKTISGRELLTLLRSRYVRVTDEMIEEESRRLLLFDEQKRQIEEHEAAERTLNALGWNLDLHLAPGMWIVRDSPLSVVSNEDFARKYFPIPIVRSSLT